jgi:hypothetical protein
MTTTKKSTDKKTISKRSVATKRSSMPRPNNLTKGILVSAAKKGFAHAAAQTLKIMGYNTVVHKGWVVKKYADGRIEKIKKLSKTDSKEKLALD